MVKKAKHTPTPEEVAAAEEFEKLLNSSHDERQALANATFRDAHRLPDGPLADEAFFTTYLSMQHMFALRWKELTQ